MAGGLLGEGAIECVLFDLDGTLIDTAPDMVAVLGEMQAAHGADSLPYERARAFVSTGAIGLVRLAFPAASEVRHKHLHAEYLERYQAAVCIKSSLFPGLNDLIETLDQGDRPWGVVTNKPQRMTEPLLAGLNLLKRAACVISGDTLTQRKPHPAPLLLASKQTGIEPASTVYVGDADRDIQAAQAAGMATVAAAYGYIRPDDDPAAWQADALAANTKELTKILLKAVNLDA